MVSDITTVVIAHGGRRQVHQLKRTQILPITDPYVAMELRVYHARLMDSSHCEELLIQYHLILKWRSEMKNLGISLGLSPTNLVHMFTYHKGLGYLDIVSFNAISNQRIERS